MAPLQCGEASAKERGVRHLLEPVHRSFPEAVELHRERDPHAAMLAGHSKPAAAPRSHKTATRRS
jgi:hypothetical protein